MLETYIDLLDLCYFEVTEAFKDHADENVWKRPHDGLLSVGELAGHIAYGEASRFAGDAPDGSCDRELTNSRIKSPLLDPRFRYYSVTRDILPTDEQRQLTAAQVESELIRIHNECMEFLRAYNPDLESNAPHWGSTYKELLKYLVFHISYHTGQMYSVRHLLGEETPDN